MSFLHILQILLVGQLLIAFSLAFHPPAPKGPGPKEIQPTNAPPQLQVQPTFKDIPQMNVAANSEQASWLTMNPEKTESSFFHILPKQRKNLEIFCWNGTSPIVTRLCFTAHLTINMEKNAFQIFKGSSPLKVKQQLNSSAQLSSTGSCLSPHLHRIHLHGFTTTCVGILTDQQYRVSLVVRPVEISRAVLFVIGVILVLYSRRVCGSTEIYNSLGIARSLVGPLFVAVKVVCHELRSKPVPAAFVIGSWVLIWHFFYGFLQEPASVLFGITYAAAVGSAGFMTFYFCGGECNHDAVAFVQCGCQLVGMAAVYLSASVKWLGMSLMILAMILDVLLNLEFGSPIVRLRLQFFPPKPRRILTAHEYDMESTTEAELHELRRYAKTNLSWDMISKLKNPSQFGNFVNGGDHVEMEKSPMHQNNSKPI